MAGPRRLERTLDAEEIRRIIELRNKRHPWLSPLGEEYTFKSWREFQWSTIYGGMYEDEFRNLVVERLVKPWFDNVANERQYFDIVAYKSPERAQGETTPSEWEWKKQGIPSFVNRDLSPPSFFPGRDLLVGFELKTNADDPERFITQLPRYCWVFDRVVLVLDSKLKIPKRLPAWVQVWQWNGESFERLREGSDVYTFLGHRSVHTMKWYQPSRTENFDYRGAASVTDFMIYLRKLFINGMFHREVVPWSSFDVGLSEVIKAVSINSERLHQLGKPCTVEELAWIRGKIKLHQSRETRRGKMKLWAPKESTLPDRTRAFLKSIEKDQSEKTTLFQFAKEDSPSSDEKKEVF